MGKDKIIHIFVTMKIPEGILNNYKVYYCSQTCLHDVTNAFNKRYLVTSARGNDFFRELLRLLYYYNVHSSMLKQDHIRFIERCLQNEKSSSPNIIVNGDFKRFPLEIQVK